MTSEPIGKLSIRKIMVALESSSHSQAALEAAAQLASSLQAELHALFVEDVNLSRLAALPMAHQVQVPSGLPEPLDQVALSRAFRAQAIRLRRRLAGVAEAARIRYTFRSVQGEVAEQVLSAAREADLIIIGRACAAKTMAPLGSTAQAVARHSTPSVLVVRRGTAFRAPLHVVYEDPEASRKTLETALHLAAATGHRVTVLILAEGPERAADLEQQVASLLRHLEPGQSSTVIVGRVSGLLKQLKDAGQGSLLISADSPLLEGDGILRLLNSIEIPVFLIR